MPYPNDRRKHRVEGEEVLSAEYLAMLHAGSEARLAERDAARRRQQPALYGRRKDDLPVPQPPEQERRRG